MHSTAPIRRDVNWAEIESILGPEHLRAATPEDAIGGLQPLQVAEPADQDQLARTLAWANSLGLLVSAVGNRTKLEWGNPLRSLDLVISTRRLDRILEHASADMTATVEAGCTIRTLQESLASRNQRLALDPLWPSRSTIGGILATNDSGSLRIRFGALRDLVIGVTVALPDGTLARSGGKVVKNVAGYDLPKLMTGSLGTLGVITQAIFRLHPLPKQVQTLAFTASDTETANRVILAIQSAQLTYTGLQMAVAHDHRPQIHIRLEGIEAGVAAQAATVRSLASSLSELDAPVDPWDAREQLWTGSDSALICKLSVLPSQLAETSTLIARLCSSNRGAASFPAGEGASHIAWRYVAQSTGLGTLRLDSQAPDNLVSTAAKLRAELQAKRCSLVVLHRPAGATSEIDAWGSPGDALPLMQRIKQQFDPKATLNPGRFVGGI